MYGIFYNLYLYTLDFFLDLQKIKNYKNIIIKKIRRNNIMAQEKKKKSSPRWSTDRFYGGVTGYLKARRVFWDFILVIIALFILTSSLSTKMTRIDTEIKPLLAANIPVKIANIESDIKNIYIFQQTQSEMLSNIFIFQNFFNELKEETKKYFNPKINDELKAFLGKMQEKEFMEINNSPISEIQKVIEIIIKIGGMDKLMDLLETKDRMLGLGVVILFVDNYNF